MLELENPAAVLQNDPVLSQFQQSQSLPRTIGRDFNWRDGRQQGDPPPVPPKKKLLPRMGSSDFPGVQQKFTGENVKGHHNGFTKSSDDMDLEQASRIRLISTPDVVRSTMAKKKEEKYNEDTIDSIIATPKKIVIPERYVPETCAELTEEEQAVRDKKRDAIKKMLLSSEATQLPDVHVGASSKDSQKGHASTSKPPSDTKPPEDEDSSIADKIAAWEAENLRGKLEDEETKSLNSSATNDDAS